MSETMETIAAGLLKQVRLTAKPLDKLPDTVAPPDLDTAYAVQDALNRSLSGAGMGGIVGHKIGCTTKVMQEYMQIPHPCSGAMFAATVFTGEASFPRSRLCRPGVECEIAVTLARDIVELPNDDIANVAPFVDKAMASIELVDQRWTDFRKVATPSLVSDNFFNAGCVLSKPVRMDPMKMDRITGRMLVNGGLVGEGIGADILGHPLAALSWLARHQIARGKPLRAGEIVTLGSVVQTIWVEAGNVIEVEMDALGSCALTLS
ncbi:2-keto-4-pentenoate hydratase [Shimia biformata]|uniref:2-keto-4-pentenoate hydratase n=1 Tax=Shimia biformata TaxID=1294299 RepID=UPI00194F0610|nr:fumarylacetoacetate hydrolase family protein [Shimia biformata]